MYTWLKKIELFSDNFQISDSHKENYIRTRKFTFNLLKSLNPETKILLSPKMDQFIREEADIRYSLKEFTLDLAFSSVFIPYAVSALFAPLFISRIYDIGPSLGGWIGVYTLHILMSALLVFGIIAISGARGLARTFRETLVAAILFFTLFQFLPYAININSYKSLSFFYHLFASTIAGVLSIFILGGIMYVAGIGLVLNQQKRKEARAPVATIVERLCDTLIGLEQDPDRCVKLECKSDLLYRIGKVARLIESNLPKLIVSSDDYTDYWSKQLFTRIAATFRSLNRKIIAPQEKTADELTALLAKYLELIVLGRWGEIDQMEPEQLNLAKRGWLRIEGLVRGGAIGIVPLLMIFILQGIGVGLEKSLFDDFKIGASIWAVLSIIITLDPQFKDKVTTFKDLAGLK